MASKRGKWLKISLISIVVLVIAAFMYINHIQTPFEKMKKEAIQLVKIKSNMTKINRVVFSAFEEKHVIVFGYGEDRRTQICWVMDSGVHCEYESNGVSLNKVKQTLLKVYPNADIEHIVPVKWRDEFAWEVFFQPSAGKNIRKQYIYYKFSTGEKLANYQLHL